MAVAAANGPSATVSPLKQRYRVCVWELEVKQGRMNFLTSASGHSLEVSRL